MGRDSGWGDTIILRMRRIHQRGERTLKRVIIDTDPGIDDAAAVLLALASPELSVEAITTVYGNGAVETCTANAYRVLDAASRLDIPVLPGAGKPLLRNPAEGWASQVHGDDALGNTNIPLPTKGIDSPDRYHAAVEIVQRVMASPGQLSILALGRLTNLALALSLEPRLAQAVKQIIIMGGTVHVAGNVSPVASANLYEDPESAAIVYASGSSLVQVGLDVCNKVCISLEQLDGLSQADTAAARLLTAATGCLRQYYLTRGLITETDGVRYNDVPAVAFAIDPSLFRGLDMEVHIETQSPLTRGQTVAESGHRDGRNPNVHVCLEVDAPKVTELFTQRIADYRGPREG